MKIDKIRFTLGILALISLGFLVRGYVYLWDISDWPTANGKIISFELGEHSSATYSKFQMQNVDSEKWNEVEYEYAVGDVTYRGHRISPNYKATLPGKKREETVIVFYNPTDHSESYLLSQRYHNPLLLGLFAASLIGLAVDVVYTGKNPPSSVLTNK